jgi:phosphatidate cytidylyltransferase
MKQRIITALWGIPLLVAFIWFEPHGFPLLIIVVAVGTLVGVLEFYRLARLSDGQPLTLLGLALALGYTANAYFENDYTLPLLAAAAVLPLLWLGVTSSRDMVFTRWSWTLAGILYVGWMLSHYVAMRELDDGRQWVFLAITCVFLCDTGAYFGGRAFGKHRMAPSISPGKTWEGAVSGFVWAVGGAMLFKVILVAIDQDIPITYMQMALLGALIAVFGQIGDLCESQLKRKAGVKDSGSIFPGHGGILDRLDSLLPAGVVVYYYALVLTG